MKNGKATTEEELENEVEMQYVGDVDETENTGESLREKVKNNAPQVKNESEEDYSDEEADVVPNLREKVKNANKKSKKKKKQKQEDATDLMDSNDLPNSFNNFYRVETKNFPTESSEESGNENN